MKIKIKLDLEKDAWNWWEACNKTSNGVNWKTRINKQLQEEIVGKTQEEAFNFLIPYLEKYYSDKNVDVYIKKIENYFNSVENEIFSRMKKITNRDICSENFTLFLTSFPRFPYDYNNSYIWISDRKDKYNQLSIFIHELLHFQYFEYFGEKIWDELGRDAHAEIREAMTVILNDEFYDITNIEDEGYEIHRSLRLDLLKIWRSSKNMDVFIDNIIDFYRNNKK
ncbi:hypothetical protein EOL94_01350 [bacterium]|nr:hypothetical protein [bacterium]